MFVLNIRTDGDAFAEPGVADPQPTEVARILREVAVKIERGDFTGKFQTVLDVNGNDVGRFKLTRDEEA